MIGLIKGLPRKVNMAGSPQPIVTFTSNVSGLYLPEILAYIQATQSGTGDPSPSNIRPIDGWSETNVTVEKNNILKYANTSQSGTISGVDYSFSNGRIVLNGTTTGLFTLSLDLAQSANLNPSANKIMFRNNQANMNVIVYFRRSNTNVHYWTMNTINRVAETWTDSGNEKVDNVTIVIGANITLSNFVLFPLLCEKTYNPTIYTINLGGTYYGGYLNVTTGLLTRELKGFSFNTAQYYGTYGSDNANLYYVEIPDYLTDKIKNIQNAGMYGTLGSNLFVKITTNNTADMKNNEIRTQAGTPRYFYFRADSFADLTELNAFLANTPLQVVAELQTPTTHQLTPAQLTQLLGQNNVFCSSGDVEVDYWHIN